MPIFGSIQIYPSHTPPHPNWLRSLIVEYCPWKYYAKACSYPNPEGPQLARQNAYFLLYPNLPLTHTPHPNRLHPLIVEYCAWKYYAETCSYPGSTRKETQIWESNLRPHCYQHMLLPLSHTILYGLVVKACAHNSVVLGLIPDFGFHSRRYQNMSKIRRNTSQRNICGQRVLLIWVRGGCAG
jgi:hypothetical protein